MPVYFIVSYDIEDAARYERYVPGVIPLLEKHGAEVLVADYEATTVETDEVVTAKLLRDKTSGSIPGQLFVELVRGDKAWQRRGGPPVPSSRAAARAARPRRRGGSAVPG